MKRRSRVHRRGSMTKRKKRLGKRRSARSLRGIGRLGRLALMAGRRLSLELPANELSVDTIQRHWAEWIAQYSRKLGWNAYFQAVRHYLRGLNSRTVWIPHHTLLLPTSKRVAIVVTAMNERSSLPGLLAQVNRLPVQDKYVVINGSNDDSMHIAKQYGATVIHYQRPLGHDVGRAVGAKATNADIVLFMDGDFVLPAEHLVPFIAEIEHGADVALNNINPWLRSFQQWDLVTMWKQFLNMVMNRRDLGANSLTAVPHALSRKAIETIGAHQLIVPPKALAAAIENGLVVTAPYSVNVLEKNKRRPQNTGQHNLVSHLISGDHLEALRYVMDRSHHRLQYSDTMRKREVAGGDQA